MTSVSEHLKVYIVYVPTTDRIQLWLQQLCEEICRASSPLFERFYHGETGMETAEGSEEGRTRKEELEKVSCLYIYVWKPETKYVFSVKYSPPFGINMDKKRNDETGGCTDLNVP